MSQQKWRKCFSERKQGSQCVQNVPGRVCEASPVGDTHRKAAQRSIKHQVAWLISDLVWSRIGMEPTGLSEIAVDRGLWEGVTNLWEGVTNLWEGVTKDTSYLGSVGSEAREDGSACATFFCDLALWWWPFSPTAALVTITSVPPQILTNAELTKWCF